MRAGAPARLLCPNEPALLNKDEGENEGEEKDEDGVRHYCDSIVPSLAG
jgi:hypothetical protein